VGRVTGRCGPRLGEDVSRIKREAWLNLGRHSSLDDAWEHADDLLRNSALDRESEAAGRQPGGLCVL